MSDIISDRRQYIEDLEIEIMEKELRLKKAQRLLNSLYKQIEQCQESIDSMEKSISESKENLRRVTNA